MSFAAPYLAVLDVKVALDGKAIFVESVVHIQLRLLSPYLDMHFSDLFIVDVCHYGLC